MSYCVAGIYMEGIGGGVCRERGGGGCQGVEWAPQIFAVCGGVREEMRKTPSHTDAHRQLAGCHGDTCQRPEAI